MSTPSVPAEPQSAELAGSVSRLQTLLQSLREQQANLQRLRGTRAAAEAGEEV